LDAAMMPPDQPNSPAARPARGHALSCSLFARQIRAAVQADALQLAFPGWPITVQNWAGDRLRIEAVNQGDGDLYALISSDPAEIWQELRRTS
jgi:hypothetical protein